MPHPIEEPVLAAPVISGGSRLRRVAKPGRQASYDDEVRQLIVATQTVMLRIGRTEQPRVADIVREAGMSNQAFYRHFRSRDDVIVATYEQGLLTIHSYLERKVLGANGLDQRIRAWIDGVLAQIEDATLSELSTTIMWNLGQIARNNSDIKPVGRARILDLLTTVLTEAEVVNADRTAQFVHTLVMGMTTTYLESGDRPTPEDREHLSQFCLDGITRI
ncbi:TetR/AcrR family transcriptional regulator [Rhodococcus sp. 14-2470-1a]|uniref:TetR/AcrR family transcriptional regulator n=1 Tax=Rhodococcus sp. 14-2470-1a TaxID=2023150 RepID=UPI00117A83E3|nr:TetR/AcrR family transcriptional regulator [Rhodococcus sp. 14-2470-1a]